MGYLRRGAGAHGVPERGLARGGDADARGTRSTSLMAVAGKRPHTAAAITGGHFNRRFVPLAESPKCPEPVQAGVSFRDGGVRLAASWVHCAPLV